MQFKMVYECTIKGQSELVIADADKFHDWLGGQGIRPSLSAKERGEQLARYLCSVHGTYRAVTDWSMEDAN